MAGFTTSATFAAGLKAALSAPAAAPSGPGAAAISAWLGRLAQLQGVPFTHLVPDPRMLPPESLRFFVVDANWVGALLDGALSIGRSAGPQQFPNPAAAAAPASGFLLRSAVVTAWPQMTVQAFGGGGASNPLATLRLETLAPGLLFALFQGMVASVTFSEPPEGLHFGFNLPNEQQPAGATLAVKYLGTSADRPVGSQNTAATVSPVLRSASGRVIDVAATAAALIQGNPSAMGSPAPTAFTPAEFALEMAMGTQSVTVSL